MLCDPPRASFFNTLLGAFSFDRNFNDIGVRTFAASGVPPILKCCLYSARWTEKSLTFSRRLEPIHSPSVPVLAPSAGRSVAIAN